MKNKYTGLVLGLIIVAMPLVSEARSVLGTLNSITSDGFAVGWAFDPDSRDPSVDIQLSVDGPWGSSGYTATGTANMYRADVNAAHNITGNHGFRIELPARVLNGKEHQLYAYGVDLDPSTPPEPLRGAPMTYSALGVTPTGAISQITADGVASGWAVDPEIKGLPIRVDFYVDGPPGRGVLAGNAVANGHRPDYEAGTGYVGDHGVSFVIPEKFRDNTEHQLYAYAINAPDTAGSNVRLPFSTNKDKFTLAPHKACTLGSVQLKHGETRTFYSAASVYTPNSCTAISQARTCTYGVLSGSNTYSVADCSQIEPYFYQGFPSYVDKETGNKIYQISDDPGDNVLFYYRAYGHQYTWEDPDIVVLRGNIPGQNLPKYSTVNLRTGERKVILNNTANGEYVFHDKLYAYNIVTGKTYFGRADLHTAAWTSLYQIPEGWNPIGVVTVNSNETYAIIGFKEKADTTHMKIVLLTLATGESRVLADFHSSGPSTSDNHYEHFAFSPADPQVFMYANQISVRGLSRIGVGTVSDGQLQPKLLPVEADPGSYFDPTIMRGVNMSHPFWDVDGRLCTDVLWHRQNPAGTFGFVCFKLPADPHATIPKANQELRFLPGTQWNTHYSSTGIPNWFVADGSMDDAPQTGSINPHTNIMHMTKVPDSVLRYKTDVYNIAELKGAPLNPTRMAFLVGGGRGVMTQYEYNIGTAGSSTAKNVFVVEIPKTLRDTIIAARQTSAVSSAPVSPPTVTTTSTPPPVTTATPIATPAPTQILSPQIGALLEQVSSLQVLLASLQHDTSSSASPSTCPVITRTLSRGSKGEDVAALQRFLISQNLLASGNDSGYFGPLTEAAIKTFQCKTMNICSGSSASNGYGAVGPKTRVALAKCGK